MKTSKIAVWVLVAVGSVCCGLWVTTADMLAQDQAQQPARRSVDLSFQRMLDNGVHGNFSRTAVPGGWLVVLEPIAPDTGTSMVFIPDETHQWNGKTLPKSR